MSEKKETKAGNEGTANFRQLKAGDYLSMTSYLLVNQINGSDLDVTDQHGQQFSIRQGGMMDNNLVTNAMHSATQEHKVVMCTRTEVVEHLMSAGDAVFTVGYNLKVDPEEAFELVKTGGKIKTHEDQKKAFKEALKGKDRVLTGHLLRRNDLGRSLVYDLVEKGIRWVDHRTIYQLTLKGTIYIVKK